MHYSTLAVAAFAALAAADEYHGDGNTNLALDKNSAVKFGDKPPADVLASLADHCDAGTCTADSWTFPVLMMGVDPKGIPVEGTVTVTAVDASYRPDNVIRDGMIDALKQLSSNDQIYKKESETYPDCFDPTDVSTCTDVPVDQYTSSSTFDIRINGDPNAPLAETDHLRIHVTSEVNDDEFSEVMCNTLVAVGGALAGGIETGGTTIAAGISLGSLICGSF